MVIPLKNAVKLFGVFIMCYCAALPCTLFLNSNIDMLRMKDQITDPEMMKYFDTLLSSGYVTSAIAGGALLLTTVVMLFFYIKHYIDTHKSELGILKAMGYSDFKIAKSFWVFGFSVFAGTGLGFGSAFILMPAFYEQMRNEEGFLPKLTIHFHPELVVYLILLPAIFFSLLSILYSCRKLKQPALSLIRGTTEGRPMKKKKPVKDKEQRFLQDLKQSTLRSRFSLVFFIAFSAFCYSDMTQMSVSMLELSSGMMALIIMGIGLVLAFTTLFIAIVTVMKANTKTIAMMKVFGYSDTECGRAVLSGYRPAAYIGFMIGTAYQYGLLKVMVDFFYDQSVVDIPEYHFDVPAFWISLITYAVLYEAIMKVYTARMKRISLKEVMLGE